MATVVRKTDPTLATIVTAFNALKTQIGAGSKFHLDASELRVTFSSLSGTGADNETLAINAAYELAWVFYKHRISGANGLEHVAAESATAPTRPTTLAAAYTLINAAKAAYNTHIASTTYHFNADSTNACATTDASSLSTLQTLANAFKTKLNAHMADAPSAPSLRLVNA